MSRETLERETSINSEFNAMEKKAAKVVSELTDTTNLIKLLIPFLHDNVLNNKGDLKEEDRLLTRDKLVPLFPQLQQLLVELTEVFEIHDDDVAVWTQKLNDYIAKYPNCINEAESRFPKVNY